MKRILVLITIIMLMCCLVATFTACDSGEYIYDGTLGNGFIKLGNFKKATINTEIIGLTYNVTGKYDILDKDNNGNKKVEIYIKVEGEDVTLNAYINSDGYLIVEDIYRFMK